MPGIAQHLRTLLASCSERKRIRRRWGRRSNNHDSDDQRRTAANEIHKDKEDGEEEHTSHDLSSSSEEGDHHRWNQLQDSVGDHSPDPKHRKIIGIDLQDSAISQLLPSVPIKVDVSSVSNENAVELPQDVWRDICSYVNDPITFCRLSCVSKELQQVVVDEATPVVWRRLYENRWIRPSTMLSTEKTVYLDFRDDSSNWKRLFQRRFALERGGVICPVRRLSHNNNNNV